MNDKIYREFLIQFIGFDDDGDLMFRMDTDGSTRLTISKKCFPIHKWQSGTDGEINRKTIIEIFDEDEDALDYVRWN